MREFLLQRLDYLYLLYGTSFVLLAVLTRHLRGQKASDLPWGALQLFGFAHGLFEWLALVALRLPDAAWLPTVRLVLLAGAFFGLLHFGLGSLRVPRLRDPRLAPGLAAAVVALLGLGAAANGMEGALAFAHYGLALPAAAIAAYALVGQTRQHPESRRAYRVCAAALGFYGLAAGLVPAPDALPGAHLLAASGFQARTALPLEALRAVAAAVLTHGVWLLAFPILRRAYQQADDAILPLRIRGLMVLLGLLLVAGGAATELADRLVSRNQARHLDESATSVAATLDKTLLDRARDADGAPDGSNDPHLIALLDSVRDAHDVALHAYLGLWRGTSFVCVAHSRPREAGRPERAACESHLAAITPEERRSLEQGVSLVTRPRQGPWVSAVAPALPGTEDHPPLFFGLDVATSYFERLVSVARLYVICLVLLVALLVLDLLDRQLRAWRTAAALAASEARQRVINAELEQRVILRTRELESANERLRREMDRLREAEVKYRTLTDQLPAITYTVTLGAHPRTTFISPQVEALLGFTPAEWAEDPGLWLRQIHPEDRDRVAAEVLRSDATGAPLDVEYRLITREGRTRWFRTLHRYVRDPSQRPVQAHGVMLDITERVQDREALQEAGERYRLLFEHSPVGVFHYDTKLCVTETNERLVQILRTTRAKLMDLDLNQLRDTSVLPTLRTALSGGEGYHENFYHATTSDIGLWIGMRTAPVFGTDGRILGGIAIVEDLTDRHRLEEDHLRTQKLESLGLLAGGLAHDFNNILTAVLGNISMLRQIGASNPQEAQEILGHAERATLRARELTLQLLTFAKGGAPVKKPVNLAELVREAAAFTVRGSSCKCAYHLAPDTWAAEVDPGQIAQVIQNLVINADQAMPEGGTITLETANVQLDRGDVPPLPPGPYVRVQISDTGVGIPDRYLGRIFDPYFTTKQKGSGLGLTMCFSILQKHGGHIRVTSRVSHGTTFSLYLPALVAHSPSKAAPDEAAIASADEGARILVMDDEPAVLDLTRRLLERVGYEVETTADGEAAIEAYRRAQARGRPFHAVILDLTVPGGMGGRETLQRLRVLDPDVRALVSSGYSTEDVMSQFKSLGFAGIVPKPYTARELLAALQAVRPPHPSQAE